MATQPGLPIQAWLKVQIDSEQFEGLEYVDTDFEKKQFRIPWNKKHTEKDEDRLFEAYAKYRKTRPKGTPKTLFRNSLNKCPYITCVYGEVDLQEKNYKIFRFLEAAEVEEKKKQLKNRSGKNSPQSSPDGQVVGVGDGGYTRGRIEPEGAEQLAEALPQLSIEDWELDLDNNAYHQAECSDMDEMDVSFVGELFEPVTELHILLQQLSIPLTDLGKFLLSVSYQGTAVHSEMVDLIANPIWIMHGNSIEQYKEILKLKKKVLIDNFRPVPLPKSDNPEVMEIIQHTNLGFAVSFDFASLRLIINRFSQAKIFERNCNRENKINRNNDICHSGFGYESLYFQPPNNPITISEQLKFEFNVGHSHQQGFFPYITVRLQSAVTEKIEQTLIKQQSGGDFFTKNPRVFLSEETSVERSVERVKKEQGE